MAIATAHLAADGDPRFTACGEPWQGWQEPENHAPRAVSGPVLEPFELRKGDPIRQCQACLRVALSDFRAALTK